MRILTLICGILFVAGSFVQPARAIPLFKTAFEEKIVAKTESDELKAAFKKAGCNTCHLKGKKKEIEFLNEYGKELEKMIEGVAQERLKTAGQESPEAKEAETQVILKELEKAFEEAAKMKNKAGDVFGERIKAGQLPAGEEEK